MSSWSFMFLAHSFMLPKFRALDMSSKNDVISSEYWFFAVICVNGIHNIKLIFDINIFIHTIKAAYLSQWITPSGNRRGPYDFWFRGHILYTYEYFRSTNQVCLWNKIRTIYPRSPDLSRIQKFLRFSSSLLECIVFGIDRFKTISMGDDPSQNYWFTGSCQRQKWTQ